MSDATIYSLDVHADDRGSVRESFRASRMEDVPPIVQLVHSRSEAGVLRGMHAHALQWDVWHFIEGTALVQTWDVESGEHGTIWADAGMTIAIPPGVAHGFWTPTGCVLMYALTREYDGTDEYEFSAYDPTWPGAGLWPRSARVIRSDRDRLAPAVGRFLRDWQAK